MPRGFRSPRAGLALMTALLWVAASGSSMSRAAGPQGPPSSSHSFNAPASRALLNQYLATCHNDRLKTAGLTLDSGDLWTVGSHAEVWEKVVRKLRTGAMPPPGVRRPDEATSDRVAAWLEAELDRA